MPPLPFQESKPWIEVNQHNPSPVWTTLSMFSSRRSWLETNVLYRRGTLS